MQGQFRHETWWDGETKLFTPKNGKLLDKCQKGRKMLTDGMTFTKVACCEKELNVLVDAIKVLPLTKEQLVSECELCIAVLEIMQIDAMVG